MMKNTELTGTKLNISMLNSTKPLYEQILKSANQNTHRFCTPSHKGVNLDCFLDAVLPFDLTELPDTDNLWAPEGVIKEAEQLASQAFFSQNTCFITTGASTAVKASIFLTANKGKLLCDRFCHHSLTDALALCDTEPVWVTGAFNAEFNIPLPPTAQQLDTVLSCYNEISAVFITTPNYYGVLADIPAIKKVCCEHSVILIVDNSHGTHLAFFNNGELHPMNCGADICIDSAHKTMPVLTGGAMLHSNLFNKHELKQALSLFSSSSPSYLTLASLDFAREFAENNKVLFDNTANYCKNFKQQLAQHEIKCLSDKNTDPMRVSFNIPNAKDIYNTLYKNGFSLEMCDNNNIVAIFSPICSEKEINMLASEIKILYNSIGMDIQHGKNSITYPELVPKMSLREAVFSQKEFLNTDDCIGRISAQTVTVYPPSIPIIIPGEEITAEISELITGRGIKEILVVKGYSK